MPQFTKSVLTAALLCLTLIACDAEKKARPSVTVGNIVTREAIRNQPLETKAPPANLSSKCNTVKLGDIGWSDITATSALSSVVLEGLGYKAQSTVGTVPVIFDGLKASTVDVFLGYWSPSMTPIVDPLLKARNIQVVSKPNLTGAKYTLAVPTYAYEAGLQSFADIAKFKDKLGGKIYGIEPGNDGNKIIIDMIGKNAFGLGAFKIVESNEGTMLNSVSNATKNNQWIVFLGWAPHPMNVQQNMTYLSGGDEFFGANYGEASVYSVTATDLSTRCPNVNKFINNLEFNVDMENQVMGPIMEHVNPNTAAKTWLSKNPAVLDKWLDGVNTIDGKPGLAAVRSYLGV